MSARIWLSSVALSTFAIFAVVSAAPSAALTAKECSVKYKAAKAAGTLNGETWNDFRKKECAGPESTTESKPAQKLQPQAQRLRQGQCFLRASMQSMPRSPQARLDFIRVLINTKPTSLPTATAG